MHRLKRLNDKYSGVLLSHADNIIIQRHELYVQEIVLVAHGLYALSNRLGTP